MVFAFTTAPSLGIQKSWLPDLEWRTVKNWMDNRVPEDDNHVIFPLETRHAVGMPISGDHRFSEIDLARSGSLVLPRDGSLQLNDLRKSPKRISRWLKEGHLFWADPQNWNGSSEAAPHLEQVPCRQDDIILPSKQRTFSVLMPMRKIEVRSVRIADEKNPLESWQWMEMENQREFDKGIFTVAYADYSCEKCPCQNDPKGDYLEEICAIQRPKCGFTPCEFPLTVEGHCCRYCGGRLSLSSKASLSMVRAAASEALEGYAERVAWHVRRCWDGTAEVLIKEKGDYSGIDILEAVENMRRTLLSMKIEVLSTETAGAAMRDHRVVVALVPLFGTPLIILGLFFIGFTYFGYSSRYILSSCGEIFTSIRDGIRVDNKSPQGSKPFSFARFENVLEGNVRIADVSGNIEQGTENEVDGAEEASGGRFENPLYRSKRRRKEEEDEEVLDMNSPLTISMATLKDKVEDRIEEVDVDIDE
ncbi:Protein amnionless [Dufourea novaeangliae]|uniref:Protein amnionless n=2 Tax=Dufourea novaeangliae TaxID=178035 RepID=A0A154P7Y5_DUFNO|nr:Protein amnionless [Dufourea novaeangliae]